MKLSTVVTTLRRITHVLRKLTKWVQPWDDLPVRHWWDVYAK